MYNLRYHIASLLGVFLALALGLVLGGLVVERGGMRTQEDALIAGLQREFSGLRTENAKLTKDNEMLAPFANDMAAGWTQGRAAGKTFIVIASAGRSDGLSAVTEAIEGAGGSVAVVTLTEANLGMGDEEIRSKLTSSSADVDAARTSIMTSLVAEWTQPMQDRPVTAALVDAGVLSVKGLEPGVVPAGLVDIAARSGKPDKDALELAEAFGKTGRIAVAGQTTGAGNGVAAAGSDRGLAALDTLGTGVGRYTLIALFSGADPAYYGMAKQVEAPYPPIVLER